MILVTSYLLFVSSMPTYLARDYIVCMHLLVTETLFLFNLCHGRNCTYDTCISNSATLVENTKKLVYSRGGIPLPLSHSSHNGRFY